MDDSRYIENLIYTYAERIDAGDLEGVADLFRDGAIVAPAHDARMQGYEEVLALYQMSCRIHPDTGTPKTRHLTTNVIVEVDGDSATARSTYTVIQATDTLPLQPIITGRYHDSFRKGDSGWYFDERAMFVDFSGDCSQHLLYDLEALSGE
ncbi:MAG: nuclear transport factor 2 family protein [Halioglobus sp.]|nr:nuclear transport factor 2 family protein [Halioglobus sp.]